MSPIKSTIIQIQFPIPSSSTLRISDGQALAWNCISLFSLDGFDKLLVKFVRSVGIKPACTEAGKGLPPRSLESGVLSVMVVVCWKRKRKNPSGLRAAGLRLWDQKSFQGRVILHIGSFKDLLVDWCGGLVKGQALTW